MKTIAILKYVYIPVSLNLNLIRLSLELLFYNITPLGGNLHEVLHKPPEYLNGFFLKTRSLCVPHT